MSSRLRLLSAFVSVILFPHNVAVSAEANPFSRCGSSSQEAVLAAEKALTLGKQDAHAALTCLIEAVKRLAVAQPLVKERPDKNNIIVVLSFRGAKPEGR